MLVPARKAVRARVLHFSQTSTPDAYTCKPGSDYAAHRAAKKAEPLAKLPEKVIAKLAAEEELIKRNAKASKSLR